MTRRTSDRIAAIESVVSQILDRFDQLEASITDRAPASEIDRLNLAFDLIADRAPASEIERLNHAFELIAERAPATEIERLNHVFEILSQRPALSETYVAAMESERVVEVPWVLGKYRGERNVMEVGYAFAEQHYLELLNALDIPFLVGIDPARSQYPPDVLLFHQIQGDIRRDFLRPSSFDLILCVSTLEHIGRDNTAYGLAHSDAEAEADDVDETVVQTLGRWLAPGGRLLLTVPFGRLEDHGWFINYDRERLDGLIAASRLVLLEETFYGWMPGGWRQVEWSDLAERGYQSLGASHAAGVALVELQQAGNES
jgi:O-antigen chain-terminating methyltransferase